MDNLNLTPKQRARLDRVARHLLDIYRTLVRMQYLDADWVIPGPHDIEHLVPTYRQHHLHDSIIYLYSRLPYVEAADSDLTFYGGSHFVDFRIDWHVAQGRKAIPFEDDDRALKPWMTTLSKVQGREDIAIVYSALDDCIWIRNFMEEGSIDPYFNGERGDYDQEREDSLADSEDDSNGDQVTQNDEESEDEGSGDGDTDEGSESDDLYSSIDSRPAAHVLCDIAKRFADLKEDPSIGDIPNDGWQLELTKPLYIKHGWPGGDFNGEAFQIDRVRAWAIEDAKERAKEPLVKLRTPQYYLDQETPEYFARLEADIGNASTLDEEWQARWQMEQKIALHEQRVIQLKNAEEVADRLCPGGVIMQEQHVPLWETENLRSFVENAKQSLEKAWQDAEEMHESREDVARALKMADIKVKNATKNVTLMEAAYHQSREDTQRLCPGQTFTEATGWKPLDQRYPAETLHEKELRRLEVQRLLNRYRGWLDQVPEEATTTREAVTTKLQQHEAEVVGLQQRIDLLKQQLPEMQ